MSILPICDEFVTAVGDCDPDDKTLEEIRVSTSKIRIIHTVWDLDKYPRGMEHAHQTDIAKSLYGDWLFYVQSDEVVHERPSPDQTTLRGTARRHHRGWDLVQIPSFLGRL